MKEFKSFLTLKQSTFIVGATPNDIRVRVARRPDFDRDTSPRVWVMLTCMRGAGASVPSVRWNLDDDMHTLPASGQYFLSCSRRVENLVLHGTTMYSTGNRSLGQVRRTNRHLRISAT